MDKVAKDTSFEPGYFDWVLPVDANHQHEFVAEKGLELHTRHTQFVIPVR